MTAILGENRRSFDSAAETAPSLRMTEWVWPLQAHRKVLAPVHKLQQR